MVNGYTGGVSLPNNRETTKRMRNVMAQDNIRALFLHHYAGRKHRDRALRWNLVLNDGMDSA